MPELMSSTFGEYQRIYTAVCDYVSQHYDIDTNLDEFCYTMHYSRRSVQRALAYFGQSWMKMMSRQRMNVAASQLVETDMTVREISKMVGYRQPSHFAYAFRKIYDKSPRDFRQTYKNGRTNGP